MEVINANCASLSNFEVMQHLQNIKAGKKKQKGQLATITYETLRYLEKTPCAEQTPDNIVACLKALEPFKLTKPEKLMIINTPPATAIEAHLLVQDIEERLTEEEVDQILHIVAQSFPNIQKQEDPNEEPE